MASIIFSTTGTQSIVKFEELGAYFTHPVSAYTLSDYFDIDEIVRCQTAQDAIDGGHIVVTDENGYTITDISYFEQDNQGSAIFATDDAASNLTYVGFGQESACKILRVMSTGTTYTSLWSDGNQSFNKFWSARTDYSYF